MAEKCAIINMHAFGCMSCVYTIERTGRRLPGVRDVRVDLANHEIKVFYEEGNEKSLDRIIEIIGIIGHEASIRTLDYVPDDAN